MCGIIYNLRFDGHTPIKMLRKQYDRQKSRGREGFGYVSSRKGVITDYCRATKEKGIFEELDKQQKEKIDEIMFHHRFPTSTPNFHEAAHPIWVSHKSLKYDYFVVHNGVINNDDELKKKHDELGFKYQTLLQQQWVGREGVIISEEKWNDSEAFAIELARDLDGAKAGLRHVRGSIAFVCMQSEKKSGKNVKLFFGHNSSNPLKIKNVPNRYIQIASENDGEVCIIDHLYEMNYQDFKITDKFYCIGGWAQASGYHSRDDEDYRAPALPAPNQMGFIPKPNLATAMEASEVEDSLTEMEDDIEAEKYYKMLDELYTLEDDLQKGHILDPMEKTLSEERIKFLTAEITRQDEEYIKNKLKNSSTF